MYEALNYCLGKRVQVELTTGTMLMGTILDVLDKHYVISNSDAGDCEAVSIRYTVRVKLI